MEQASHDLMIYVLLLGEMIMAHMEKKALAQALYARRDCLSFPFFTPFSPFFSLVARLDNLLLICVVWPAIPRISLEKSTRRGVGLR